MSITSTTVFSIMMSLVPTYWPTYLGWLPMDDAITLGKPKGSCFMMLVTINVAVAPPAPKMPEILPFLEQAPGQDAAAADHAVGGHLSLHRVLLPHRADLQTARRGHLFAGDIACERRHLLHGDVHEDRPQALALDQVLELLELGAPGVQVGHHEHGLIRHRAS